MWVTRRPPREDDHRAAFLHSYGVEVEGIDLVPEFVERAVARFPDVPFCVGDFESLPTENGSLGGILSWYSIIHAEPESIPTLAPTREAARTARYWLGSQHIEIG